MSRTARIGCVVVSLLALGPSGARAIFPACTQLIFKSGFENGSFFPWAGPPDCAEVEPNDGVAQANPLCTGILASISPVADHDFFRLDVEIRGTTFILETNTGAIGQCAGGADTQLRIRDGVGTELAFDDDSGVNACSLLTWADPETGPGPFYVDVQDYQDNSIIASYGLVTKVQMPTRSEVEPNDTTLTATPYCDMLTGRLYPVADADFVSFPAAIGDTITAETNDGAVGTCAAIDTVLRLYDPSGAQQTMDDDGGVNACSHIVGFVANAAGTWTVSVRDFGDDGGIPLYGLVVTVGP